MIGSPGVWQSSVLCCVRLCKKKLGMTQKYVSPVKSLKCLSDESQGKEPLDLAEILEAKERTGSGVLTEPRMKQISEICAVITDK